MEPGTSHLGWLRLICHILNSFLLLLLFGLRLRYDSCFYYSETDDQYVQTTAQYFGIIHRFELGVSSKGKL